MYCTKPEGRPLCDWTVIDAGHVLVHIFRNEIREVYDLEKSELHYFLPEGLQFNFEIKITE